MKRRHLRVVESQPKKIDFIDWVKNLLQSREGKLTKVQESYLEKYYSRKFETADKGKVEIPHFLKAKQKVNQIKKLGQIEKHYNEIKRGLAC